MKEFENDKNNSDDLWNFIVSLLDIIDDKEQSDRNKIEKLEIISKLLLDDKTENLDEIKKH